MSVKYESKILEAEQIFKFFRSFSIQRLSRKWCNCPTEGHDSRCVTKTVFSLAIYVRTQWMLMPNTFWNIEKPVNDHEIRDKCTKADLRVETDRLKASS